MTKKRRTSNLSQGSTISSGTSGGELLSSRIQKSISKSRRSSAADEKPPSRRTSLAAAISLLSLPSFIEEISSSKKLLNSMDVHSCYKVKLNRSIKKLDGFFGEPTPVDVCVGEIIKEGLKAILESKVPLCYFLHYLLEEYSAENLFFFLDVEKFENQCRENRLTLVEQQLQAQCIYEKYVSSTAKLEVNLEDREKRSITTQMSSELKLVSETIFSEAKSSVYILLETSFAQFTSTRAYNDMIQNCGELTIHYNETTTGIALNYLLGYLNQQQTYLESHHVNIGAFNHSLIELNLKRYELIKDFVQDFIKSMFGQDYLSKHNNNSKKKKKYTPRRA